jgi:SAM-dependent methyltransferase
MNPAEFANIAHAEQRFWWYRGMNRILFRVLDRYAEASRQMRVLEAGCGTGYLASLLESRYGWRLAPVDLGWQGLEFGRSLGLERMTQADIGRLPFEDCAFDVVLSMDVIVHFPRGEEIAPMRELVRVLKPGGLLVIRVSALDVLRSRHSMFAHERQRFTRSRLTRLAVECGISVQRCTYLNSLLLPAAFAKFRIWEPLTNAPPQSGVGEVPPWLDRCFYAALCAEAKWIAGGLNFPLGQSLLLVGRKASGSNQPDNFVA